MVAMDKHIDVHVQYNSTYWFGGNKVSVNSIRVDRARGKVEIHAECSGKDVRAFSLTISPALLDAINHAVQTVAFDSLGIPEIHLNIPKNDE